MLSIRHRTHPSTYDVAIKVNFSRSEDSTSQFMREAQLLAKLRHPNLPRVIQHFIHEGNEFLVMDYIPGEDFKQLIQHSGPQRWITFWNGLKN